MIKLFDSELNVMEILWKNGDMTAKELTRILNDQVGWSRTTTYTIIKKLVDKGAVKRTDPDFMCHALVTKEQAQSAEVDQLIKKMFDGSTGLLVNALLDRKDLPDKITEELKRIVEDLK